MHIIFTIKENSSFTSDIIIHNMYNVYTYCIPKKTCRILARAFSEICEIPNLSVYEKYINGHSKHIFYTYIYSNMIHQTSFLLGHGRRVEKRDTRMVPRFLCRYILSNDFHLTYWPDIRVLPSFDTSLIIIITNPTD